MSKTFGVSPQMLCEMFGTEFRLWSVAMLLLSMSCFLATIEAQVTHPSEVRALQAIRRSLDDPLNKLDTWKRGDPCTSNWTGVLCFNKTAEDGYLHVQELQLLNNNLSGTLAPELGQLSHMEILDFMWNNISGSIPKEVGSLTSLKLLLLNGNELSGPLPEDLGNLTNLDRIQIDQNHISGPLPKSFANLKKAKHFHMNNNSISGQIPPELSQLPNLVHFLLDNNNLTGYLPEEFSKLPSLLILQLDNNNFSGSSIPTSYGSIPTLLKLSLRNCSLQGPALDVSKIPELGYLDLSRNQLSGPIPTNTLSRNLTTIDLSNNQLNDSIPSVFSGLPLLQKLSLQNNRLNGTVPSAIWQNLTLGANHSLILDFQNNELTDVSGGPSPPANVTVLLRGNPVCMEGNKPKAQFCGLQNQEQEPGSSINSSSNSCPFPDACPLDAGFEFNPINCHCGAPICISYRLKSPGFSDFEPYFLIFLDYITNGLILKRYQLVIDSIVWEKGPRLRMFIRIFPYTNSTFNATEILRIRSLFTGWNIPDDGRFGPYELLDFTLSKQYKSLFDLIKNKSSGLSSGQLAGIVLGTIAGAVILSSIISILILKKRVRHQGVALKKRKGSKIQIKMDGVKEFTFEELSMATNHFSESTLIGQGGYGKVYKGVLADGTVVAIKRAQEDSLQGSREFVTEIQLLSRLHHRNLVSLIGYCDEEYEQMLVYEYMPNGTLRDYLSAKSQDVPSFTMRLRIASGSARGILYLHSEADPPIFHRDIKASNILLDSRYVAKVADFGLSRLAPVPEVEGSQPGHVSTVVKGTPGYLDPEYFLTHKLTDKSDVYSLGVVFLELLTGLPPIHQGKNIIRVVNAAKQSGMMLSVIDNRLGSYPVECVEKFLSLALRCCEDETDARPSMAEVVRELENIMRMTPDGDTMTPLSIQCDSSKVVTTPSMSMPSRDPFVSSDLLGSNLVSGTIPTITPR